MPYPQKIKKKRKDETKKNLSMGSKQTKQLFIKTPQTLILDKTNICSKADGFSGTSNYSTFVWRKKKLVLINSLPHHITTRIHLIVDSREVILPYDLQKILFYLSVKEIVLFVTDVHVIVPFQVLELS